jgi:hypothetical protein
LIEQENVEMTFTKILLLGKDLPGLALRFELALLVTFLDLVAHTVMSHFRFHFKQLPFLGFDYPRKNCKSELPVFFPKRLTREKAHLNFSSSI